MKKQNFTLKIVLCGAFVLVILLSLTSISLAQEPWTTKFPMPTARVWFSCEVVNEKIYVIGGATVDGAPTLASVEEYNPATDTWTTKTPMPTARYNMASAVVDGKIYIVGGDTIWQIGRAEGNSMLEVYDPASDTWDISKSNMPTGRQAGSGCVVDGIIYVIGGVSVNGEAIKDVEAYDPVTDTWTTKAPLPTASWAHSTAVVDGKIYTMGSGAGSKKVEEYDPATDTWTTKESMLVGNGYFGTSVFDGIIYNIGGGPNPNSLMARVFAYDPSADEWSEKIAMQTARWGLGAGVVNEKIYALGGTSGWPLSPLSTNEECSLPMSSVVNNNLISSSSFVLLQNYPNPFNSETILTYQLQQPEIIQIIIYNQFGEEIELIQEEQSAGIQQFIWNADGLPAGVYYCLLKTKSHTQTVKMIKL